MGKDEKKRGADHMGDGHADIGDGVDEGLLRWCLSLTPAERLRALQDNVNSIIRLRKGMPDGERND